MRLAYTEHRFELSNITNNETRGMIGWCQRFITHL